MKDVLGLIGIVFFVVCVIGLAAGVTWIVVRLSPSEKPSSPSSS